MHRTRLGAFLILLALLLAGQACALDLGVQERTLSNGMLMLVVERHQVPLISTQIWVRVGSADERLGKTGLAHFHEHLLFKGTETLGTTDYAAEKALMDEQDALAALIREEEKRGSAADAERIADWKAEILALEERQREYTIPSHVDQLYTGAGATGFNAGTWLDYTMYTVVVPANKLELQMWIDSDRMRAPVFREFYSERDVIMQERRETVEDAPDGPYRELFDEITFPESSYQWEIIGHMHEIARLTREDAYDFFRTFYVPNNMVYVVVGDVEADAAFEMAERYFGRIPKGEPVPPIASVQRPNLGERRIRVEAQSMPRVEMQFITTTFGTPDDAVLDVISGLLDGEGGRFNKELVLRDQVAVGCYTWNGSMRGAGRFLIGGVPAGEATHADLEARLWGQIERLKTEPVPSAELDRVKKQVRATTLRSIRDNDALAQALGRAWAECGDWRYAETSPDTIAAVTADDVMRVANEYFRKDNAGVGWLELPAGEGDAE